ncbi:MAG TPA: hypothetical protein VF266_18465 [Thermoanaerobaculia bacterium]
MRKSLAAALLLFAIACTKSEAPAAAIAAPAPAPQPAAAASPNQLAGKVLETFNGGGYTYLRIATANGEEWAAVRETQIASGANVAVDVQLTMEKFESKTLNRTFDRIAFGEIGGAAKAAAGMPPAMLTPAQHMRPPDLGAISVEKAAGGSSVAEVHAQKASLNGKEVVVRGKVVKFLGGIMGTNWMHIQDGTGSKAAGDNDLTVTTDGQAMVGDVVTVRGKLAADKDFGAGYQYPVIVEKARVEK